MDGWHQACLFQVYKAEDNVPTSSSHTLPHPIHFLIPYTSSSHTLPRPIYLLHPTVISWYLIMADWQYVPPSDPETQWFLRLQGPLSRLSDSGTIDYSGLSSGVTIRPSYEVGKEEETFWVGRVSLGTMKSQVVKGPHAWDETDCEEKDVDVSFWIHSNKLYEERLLSRNSEEDQKWKESLSILMQGRDLKPAFFPSENSIKDLFRAFYIRAPPGHLLVESLPPYQGQPKPLPQARFAADTLPRGMRGTLQVNQDSFEDKEILFYAHVEVTTEALAEGDQDTESTTEA